MINQNLSSLLEEQVALDIEGIDRLYLNVHQPLLQIGGGACYFSPVTVASPFCLKLIVVLHSVPASPKSCPNDRQMSAIRANLTAAKPFPPPVLAKDPAKFKKKADSASSSGPC